MLLILEKDIRREICHAIHRYKNQIINISKIMIKIKNLHLLDNEM